MIYKYDEKEFKLIPRTRKVIDLTERLKAKNLNELIFGGLTDINLKVLAELIKAFAEYEDKSSVFKSVNSVYDYLDELKENENMSYEDIYKEVIKVTNEMGFFKKKMSKEELEKEMNSPMINIDFKEIVKESAQKAVDTIAQEEFKGYLG